jgi:DNA mismatch endonuclease, patch repair protein
MPGGRPPVPPPGVAPPSSPNATATMRANRRRDTSPELALRSLLHRRGLRFRVDQRIGLGGRSWVRPDLVFRRAQVAVFVDGCFWHSCPEHGELPVANREFWEAKLARTVDRDRAQSAALEAAGWTVVRCWEHESTEEAAARVEAALRLHSPDGP